MTDFEDMLCLANVWSRRGGQLLSETGGRKFTRASDVQRGAGSALPEREEGQRSA